MKKLTSILLTMLIIISALPIHITAKAEETSEQTPEYVSYQAKRYSDSFTMYLDNSASYARRYYNIMKEKESVISGIAVWESAHIATDLSYAMDTGLISKRDMYQIAIFDMLGVSDSNEYIDKAFESMNSSRFWGRMSITKSLLKSETIRSADLKTLPISSEIIDFIKNDSDTIDEFFEEADMVKSVVDVGKTIYEAIDTIASYHAMCEMRDGTVDILNAIATDSENPWDLRLAASECIKHFNVGYEKALDSILNSEQVLSDAIIRKSVEILFEEAWRALIKAIPGATFVMAFAKGYRVLSNEIFKMDDTCKTYYQFCAAVELEEAVHRVMENMKNDFRENYDIQKASLYMRSVELYENIVLKGYDYTIDMLEIKATAPATKWADWLDHEYGECMELIEGAEIAKGNKRSLYTQYEDWVKNDYKKKYFSNYDSIADALNDQTTTYADSVSFTQTREIYEGDSGYIFDYIQKTYQPEKSIEYQKCYFTADNKDVFTIDQYGAFIADMAGQVTLTYDKGGELENSITITVHDKDDIEPHNYYEDFEYRIEKNRWNEGYKAIIVDYKGTRKDVLIPNSINGYSVEEIDFAPYPDITELSSITIPASVSFIQANDFDICTQLTRIIVNENNKTYSSQDGVLFNKDKSELIYCPVGKIGAYTIPANVNKIRSSAFSGCAGLTCISIPDSVTYIGFAAFSGCTGLMNITIPDSVKIISDYLFKDCTGLSRIKIPDSVTSIDGYAFENCTNLTNVTIGNGVESIGSSAFQCCRSLTSITIPDSVTKTDGRVFLYCDNLEKVKIGNGITNLGLLCIANKNLKEIIIGDGIKYIGRDQFNGCSNLESVTIGKNVESIGYEAFYECTSLESITIPDNVTTIEDYAFYGCSNLKFLTIGDGVTNVGILAFGDCNGLEIVKIGNGLSSLSVFDFTKCKNLQEVLIGNNVSSIQEYKFRGCEKLISVTIPNSVTSIGNGTFAGCTSLTNITIPDSITSINGGVFSDCSSLTSIKIPENVTAIGNRAFYNCTNLKSVTIPHNVTSIGNAAFSNCASLENITIPDNVTNIGSYLFSGCTNLKSTIIGNSITNIERNMFEDCSNLVWITIGNGVTNIDSWAFYDCENLAHIFYLGDESEWDNISKAYLSVKIHYNSDGFIKFEKTVLPSCTEKGYDLYFCSQCEDGVKINFTNALGHNFENGVCTRCGKSGSDLIESAHPYEDNTDEAWTIHKDGAKRIAVTFSDDTKTESGWDYIYFYNMNGDEVNRYSGTELAGKRVVIQGDTVRIRLTSDSSSTYYGFSITEVQPYYEECTHSETEVIDAREAGCGWSGYTGDVRCVDCQEILSYGEYTDPTEEHSMVSEVIAPDCGHKGYTYHYCENCDYSYKDCYVDATGNHNYENGVCKVCGHPDINSLIEATVYEPTVVSINNNGQIKYYKFTPKQNGTLHFYSSGSYDTYGYLYNTEMNLLTSKDSGAEDNNFNIDYDVFAGQTYLLACRMYSFEIVGEFIISVNFVPDEVLIGDTNKDGIISISDVTTIQRHLAEIETFTDEQLALADTDGDGEINIIDATHLQKYLAEFDGIVLGKKAT